MQLLLDHGADISVQKSRYLGSASSLIIQWPPPNFQNLLIERGAEVDVRNEDQATPLHLASGRGELEIARRLLVKSGSDVHAQDKYGWTASHFAAWNGHLGLIELLRDSGADADMCDSSEKTPLNLAYGRKQHGWYEFP